MGKTAFLFSGQGAQKVGMGQDIAQAYPAAMQVFDSACGALGFDIKHMIWEGDEETLMVTENTQPCIVTVEAAILAVLKENGVQADAAAGLSLGEYGAHIAAGSLAFDDAVKLVRKRGKYMQKAVPLQIHRRHGSGAGPGKRGCGSGLPRGAGERRGLCGAHQL